MSKSPITTNFGGQAIQTPGLKLIDSYLWPVGTNSTTNMVYSAGDQLHYNASGIPFSEPVSVQASGVKNMMIMNQGDYDALTPDANTIYFIT